MHKKNTSCDVGYAHNIKWGNIHNLLKTMQSHMKEKKNLLLLLKSWRFEHKRR